MHDEIHWRLDFIEMHDVVRRLLPIFREIRELTIVDDNQQV